MTANSAARASQRYLKLIEELGRERGGERGWIPSVARQLGVDQSHIWRLVNQERVSVGAEALEKAMRRLRLSSDYFFGRTEPTSYRDYVGAAGGAGPARGLEPEYAALDEFLRSKAGVSASAAERDFLVSLTLPEETQPTVAFYEGVLFMLRNLVERG